MKFTISSLRYVLLISFFNVTASELMTLPEKANDALFRYLGHADMASLKQTSKKLNRHYGLGNVMTIDYIQKIDKEKCTTMLIRLARAEFEDQQYKEGTFSRLFSNNNKQERIEALIELGWVCDQNNERSMHLLSNRAERFFSYDNFEETQLYSHKTQCNEWGVRFLYRYSHMKYEKALRILDYFYDPKSNFNSFLEHCTEEEKNEVFNVLGLIDITNIKQLMRAYCTGVNPTLRDTTGTQLSYKSKDWQSTARIREKGWSKKDFRFQVWENIFANKIALTMVCLSDRPNIQLDRHSFLTWASYRGLTGTVKLLLCNPHIDINQKTEQGYTALMLACTPYENKKETRSQRNQPIQYV